MIFTKSGTRRLLEALRESLNAANGKSRRSRRRRVALAAGGFAGLTAASAGISSLRRREGARGDS
jgi:hypothetical protein